MILIGKRNLTKIQEEILADLIKEITVLGQKNIPISERLLGVEKKFRSLPVDLILNGINRILEVGIMRGMDEIVQTALNLDWFNVPCVGNRFSESRNNYLMIRDSVFDFGLTAFTKDSMLGYIKGANDSSFYDDLILMPSRAFKVNSSNDNISEKVLIGLNVLGELFGEKIYKDPKLGNSIISKLPLISNSNAADSGLFNILNFVLKNIEYDKAKFRDYLNGLDNESVARLLEEVEFDHINKRICDGIDDFDFDVVSQAISRNPKCYLKLINDSSLESLSRILTDTMVHILLTERFLDNLEQNDSSNELFSIYSSIIEKISKNSMLVDIVCSDEGFSETGGHEFNDSVASWVSRTVLNHNNVNGFTPRPLCATRKSMQLKRTCILIDSSTKSECIPESVVSFMLSYVHKCLKSYHKIMHSKIHGESSNPSFGELSDEDIVNEVSVRICLETAALTYYGNFRNVPEKSKKHLIIYNVCSEEKFNRAACKTIMNRCDKKLIEDLANSNPMYVAGAVKLGVLPSSELNRAPKDIIVKMAANALSI